MTALTLDPKISAYPKPLPYRQAYKVFWALGDDWWMQLFDGRFIKYGPQVFDQGLHEEIGGDKEEGFYASAYAACKIASSPGFLTKNPTVLLYKKLHKIACRHFNGISTIMKANKTGKFTNSTIRYTKTFKLEVFRLSLEFEDLQRDYKKYRKCQFLDELIQMQKSDPENPAIQSTLEKLMKEFFPESTKEEVLEDYQKANDWLKAFEVLYARRIDEINAEIREKSLSLGLTHPIAILLPTEDEIRVQYQCSKKEVEFATAALFAEYNANMAKAKSQEEKLRLIANLFQMLEWLHPFPDGQGRTDLIVLMKELCHHGFTPAILEQPYVSTYCTLDEWVDYLIKGMERWQKEAALHIGLNE